MSPEASSEGLLAPGQITPAEVLELDAAYHGVEILAYTLLPAVPNPLRPQAEKLVKQVDAFRALFTKTYLYDAAPPVVDPPVDPPVVDPPVDPPKDPPVVVIPPKDPPVVEPGLPFALAACFKTGGGYAYLGAPALPTGYVLGDWYGKVGHKGALPAEFSNLATVCNDAWTEHTDWGKTPPVVKIEHGPKWAYRTYDTSGIFENATVIRAGDFTMGREGHAFYANALGSLTITNLHAIECGGQAVQIVWRASETLIPEAEWKHAEHTITLDRVRATDCGIINEGAAVRASWPISIFNPGQAIEIRNAEVEQIKAPIGHGALFVGDGEGRTPSLLVEGLKVRLKNSDRAAVRLHGVDKAVLRGLDLVGDNRVAIADSCGEVTIEAPATDLTIGIHDGSDPHRPPYMEYAVKAGETWTWKA